MTESKYSDSIVLSAGIAFLASILGFGSSYFMRFQLGTSWYIVTILVSLGLGFILFQATEKLAIRYFAFLLVGPSIAATIAYIMGISTLGSYWYSDMLVFGIAGGIVFSFSNALEDFF